MGSAFTPQSDLLGKWHIYWLLHFYGVSIHPTEQSTRKMAHISTPYQVISFSLNYLDHRAWLWQLTRLISNRSIMVAHRFWYKTRRNQNRQHHSKTNSYSHTLSQLMAYNSFVSLVVWWCRWCLSIPTDDLSASCFPHFPPFFLASTIFPTKTNEINRKERMTDRPSSKRGR